MQSLGVEGHWLAVTSVSAAILAVMAAWRDSATWGPLGRGCCWCTEGEPISHGLCASCWISCLGWAWHTIERWIDRQDAVYVRQEEKREALRLWQKDHDRSGIIRYAEKYGVWLVPEPQLGGIQ